MNLLQLKPACKDYLWGGSTLKTQFEKEFAGERLAETWELSTHPDGASIIDNGTMKGRSFREYYLENTKVLGTNCASFQDFPILIKLIDAADHLSVQVHPNDDYALREEKQYGKTEVWHVLDCAESAYIYYGFTKEISKDEFRERIENNTLLEVLNKVSVKPGDTFFIEAGTLHAICAGIVIAEIQQNSNVTYRIYDYDRRDKDGNARELHIDKALAVTDLKPVTPPDLSHGHLADCPYFTVDKVHFQEGSYRRPITLQSFVSVLVTSGSGTISVGKESLPLKKGDSFFLPAQEATLLLEGSLEALISTIRE